MTPKAPDPYQTASAQQGANIDSTVAGSLLNNMDQTSPFGSVKYTQNGMKSFKDSTGKMVQIPNWSSNTTFSPDQQALYDKQTQAGKNMGDLAVSQSARLGGVLNTPFSTNGLPAGGRSLNTPAFDQSLGYGRGTGIQTSVGGQGPGIQTSVGGQGPGIQTSVGGQGPGIQYKAGAQDYSADRRRVENAVMSRYDDGFKRDQESLRTDLINQGLTPGSEGWNTQMDALNRAKTDARSQSILLGGQEQSRMAGLDLDRGRFANEAQAQGFGQEFNRGQFRNAAQQQGFGQDLNRGQFRNAAQAQDFGQHLAGADWDRTGASMNAAQRMQDQQWNEKLRGNRMNERYAERNQPLNEISALLSGGQVTAPQFGGPFQQGVGGTDVTGLIGNDYQNKLSSYNAMMSGLFGLGSAGVTGMFGLSDRRAKENVRQVGVTFDGQPIYFFNYIGDSEPRLGLMAQDVMERKPEAVSIRPDGLYAVNYALALEAA